MTGPISRNRLLGSLKEAAGWPGAARSTVVTLATTLVAARADAEGSSYFQDLSERNPADATAQALAGFFQVRAGHDVAAAIAKLDEAATMHVAQSYDFGDFAFIKTSAGVVAIDAGTSPDRVLAAMADLGLKDHAPVSHLILTHAHFDHTGGTAAVRGPDTQVIASAGFPAEAERLRHWNPPFRYLIGTGASPAFDVQPDRLISERTSVVVGDTEFVLIPVRGGETPDALMVHLPASGLLFAGDVMMPYLGVPFTAEGSPEGLLETLRYIRELAPRQLIQGHTTLTQNFTIESLAGLEPALTELHEFALARIGENMTLPHILDLGYLPTALLDTPATCL